MAPRIMPLDVLKLRGLPKGVMHPVQIAQPPMQSGISRANIPNIALEMLDVDGVEADKRHVQPYVCLCELFAKVVGAFLAGEVLLRAVERLKEGVDVTLIGFRCGGKARFVDAVVDKVVGPGVGVVDLAAQRFRVQLDGAVLVVEEVIELELLVYFSYKGGWGIYLRAKHAQNLGALIINNPPALLVVQHRDGKPPLVVPLALKVHVPQVREVLVQRIRNHLLARLVLVLSDEAPAPLPEMPVHDGKRNDVLQTLYLSGNKGTVRLRAVRRTPTHTQNPQGRNLPMDTHS